MSRSAKKPFFFYYIIFFIKSQLTTINYNFVISCRTKYDNVLQIIFTSIERLVSDLTTISIRLSDEEKEALQKFAKEHDLTIS